MVKIAPVTNMVYHQVETKTGRSYSYANVIDRIERLAAGLRELGMGPGDVLCMMTYNHIHIPIFTLAVSMIGGVYQPLSPVNTNGISYISVLYPYIFYDNNHKSESLNFDSNVR